MIYNGVDTESSSFPKCFVLHVLEPNSNPQNLYFPCVQCRWTVHPPGREDTLERAHREMLMGNAGGPRGPSMAARKRAAAPNTGQSVSFKFFVTLVFVIFSCYYIAMASNLLVMAST